jgi:hypothetical protein
VLEQGEERFPMGLLVQRPAAVRGRFDPRVHAFNSP